jgi:hypothetical protein
MPHRRMTFSKFIVEHRRRSTQPDPELIALLDEVLVRQRMGFLQPYGRHCSRHWQGGVKSHDHDPDTRWNGCPR